MKASKPGLPPLRPLTPARSWWLLATGIAAFVPLASRVPPWLAVAAGAAFLWRAALAWWRQPLPTRWVLNFIALAGMAGVFIQHRTLFGQQAGIALLVCFMALKQLEARSARDGLAIVLLAYFMTLTQFLNDQSIPIAATLLGTVLVATATLAALTDAEERAPVLLRRAAIMLAQALPFMLLFFVLFPRVSGPLWGLPRDAYSSLTGLSDEMAPGMISNLIQSDAIAFRVKFEGAVPPKREMYWRGPVLASIEGRVWKPGRKLLGPGIPPPAPPDAPRYAYTVTLEPHNKPWLFALEFPVTLPPDAFDTADFQLHAKKPVRERLRYALESRPRLDRPGEDLRLLSDALVLPEHLNPRTIALGATLAREEADPRRRLERAIDFMRGQRLVYTLRPPLTGDDVADEFLFVTKRGFCEHFAGSFVVLMRAAGVPARVVTGYQGGERNPVDDTWVIRQSDAHAWAEVWLPGQGWVRVDPTATSAPARIEENLAAAVPAGEPLPLLARLDIDLLRELRYRWWALNNTWNQWVLGYNPERQRDFLTRLGMRAPDWRSMTALLAVLCGALLLALTGWMLWRRPRLDPVERQWRRATQRLARQGLPRASWEGPFDYARRIARAQPAIAEEIGRIAALYAGLRYGSLPPSAFAELKRCVAAFKP